MMIGVKMKDNPRCSLNEDKIDEAIESLGRGDFRFLSENMTLGQAYSIYNQWKPMSTYIAEEWLRGLCK
jgi:hypothetical protein